MVNYDRVDIFTLIKLLTDIDAPMFESWDTVGENSYIKGIRFSKLKGMDLSEGKWYTSALRSREFQKDG